MNTHCYYCDFCDNSSKTLLSEFYITKTSGYIEIYCAWRKIAYAHLSYLLFVGLVWHLQMCYKLKVNVLDKFWNKLKANGFKLKVNGKFQSKPTKETAYNSASSLLAFPEPIPLPFQIQPPYIGLPQPLSGLSAWTWKGHPLTMV